MAYSIDIKDMKNDSSDYSTFISVNGRLSNNLKIICEISTIVNRPNSPTVDMFFKGVNTTVDPIDSINGTSVELVTNTNIFTTNYKYPNSITYGFKPSLIEKSSGKVLAKGEWFNVIRNGSGNGFGLKPPKNMIINYTIDINVDPDEGSGGNDGGGSTTLKIWNFRVFVYELRNGIKVPIPDAEVDVSSDKREGEKLSLYDRKTLLTDEKGFTGKIMTRPNKSGLSRTFSVSKNGYLTELYLTSKFDAKKEGIQNVNKEVELIKKSLDSYQVTIKVRAKYHLDRELFDRPGNMTLKIKNQENDTYYTYKNIIGLSDEFIFIIKGSPIERKAILEITGNNEEYLSSHFGESYPLKSETISFSNMEITIPCNNDLQDSNFSKTYDFTIKPISDTKIATFKDFHRMMNNPLNDMLKCNPQKCISKEFIARFGIETVDEMQNGTKCEKLNNIKFN